MTVNFTVEELKYIAKEPFNWHIKENCPERLKEDIEKKLRLLYKEPYE